MLDICSICLEQIISTKAITQCNHIFHVECIIHLQSNKCPICRTENILNSNINTNTTNKYTYQHIIIPNLPISNDNNYILNLDFNRLRHDIVNNIIITIDSSIPVQIKYS
jgi:RING finger family protein